MKAIAALALLLAAMPIAAQVRPVPGPGDPRVQKIEYSADQVVQVQAAPGYQVTIALGGDERIESVAVGDSGAWSVTANKRGDHLFVKPVTAGVTTNMVVVTDLRMYNFELVPAYGPTEALAFSIRFVFPDAASATTVATGPAPVALPGGRYRLGGDRLLRPAAMSDDGVRTTIEWPASAALPAIYAIGADGKEALVTGNVRDGSIVVDSIARNYVFRQDRRTASAERYIPKRKRQR
ncbi:TrbG/VirB9 family P-type conjugative transfer protein [Sphingomonas donggukensis]|uniref:TrbG/VirB9 family P-type conjugative transfer protein n=1 Tax=Sphingomonas donggukensis TaxID=2949093 RepID=A0ABY4TR93_9SPHN|nr:TrbG/VirB9 family P-type conjugative transfer protein [Sphingomonas donggukensis]URW74906.1 TrbG/VirB9 family P-type conjugative transfer protein [Sphingomonas donggukensis]